MFSLDKIIRKNIKTLVPYSSARDEFKGNEGIFLDANENAYGDGRNRYPDPLQLSLKKKIADLKSISPEKIFLGNGSDEAIDILFRAFCEPGVDNVIVCPPTYGMYEVSANINDVQVKKVSLIPELFQLDAEGILKVINESTKLIFVCCPNNPTGNGVKWKDIKMLLEKFGGIIVVDEAYIDFASYRSLLAELDNYPNLVILQTFSKAWGMAGLRVGMAFASQEIITVFNKIKPPYNVNSISQQLVSEALDRKEKVENLIKEIVEQRKKLEKELEQLDFVLKIYPSEANFLLIKVNDPKKLYDYLVHNKIVVRDRSKVPLCEGCLRITIGTQEENKILLETLRTYEK